jgi:general secretion pathway protein B
MSFILDALKKSENDRQRQSGPALFEVRVAPPRSRFPVWAIAVVCLLAVNLAVISWLMLRRPAAAASPAASEAAPMAQTSAPSTAETIPPPAPAAQLAPNGYPVSAQQEPQGPPSPMPSTGLSPDPALADDRTSVEMNPDDYEPAREPSSQPQPGLGGRVTRGTESGLPTYEEAASKASIPPLHMDLHVYAPDPRQRFVLVNMKKLREGDALPEGVKVDRITTDGAILSYQGSKFVMDRE